MALNTEDLFRLELRIRMTAHHLRQAWPKADIADPGVPQPVRAHTELVNAEARDYEKIGDLLQGLRGNWEKTAPLLRQGFHQVGAAIRALEAGDKERETLAAETAAR